ncbi:4866_t:CDS:2, partial [Scutellospora calospora]
FDSDKLSFNQQSYRMTNEYREENTPDHIELIEPSINISNGSNSKVYNNTNHIEISGFISVSATIFQGTSVDSYIQIKQLYTLINEKKDEINKMLDSKSVYAIGPYFQSGYSVLSIACYVTKPLNKFLINELLNLFDNMYEIIEINNEGINNEAIIQDKVPSDGLLDNEGDKNHEKTNESEDRSNSENSSVKNDQFIQVVSTAKAKEDEDFQSFEINARIRANINNEDILNFSIEFVKCKASPMLNKICESFRGWFVGFYLESIIIEVSPITINNTNDDPDNELVAFILKEAYSPRPIGPENYEVSTDHVTNNTVQLNLSTQNIGANLSHSSTNSDSIKKTTNVWKMEDESCSIRGAKWLYKNFNFYKIDDHRMGPDLSSRHSGKWGITESMKGFRITIKQILRCDINIKATNSLSGSSFVLLIVIGETSIIIDSR